MHQSTYVICDIYDNSRSILERTKRNLRARFRTMVYIDDFPSRDARLPSRSSISAIDSKLPPKHLSFIIVCKLFYQRTVRGRRQPVNRLKNGSCTHLLDLTSQEINFLDQFGFCLLPEDDRVRVYCRRNELIF